MKNFKKISLLLFIFGAVCITSSSAKAVGTTTLHADPTNLNQTIAGHGQYTYSVSAGHHLYREKSEVGTPVTVVKWVKNSVKIGNSYVDNEICSNDEKFTTGCNANLGYSYSPVTLDSGEAATEYKFFGTEEELKNLTTLYVGETYNFVCPECGQVCRSFVFDYERVTESKNRYFIEFDKNESGTDGVHTGSKYKVEGSMDKQTAYTFDAAFYEGKKLDRYENKLNKNQYHRKGYKFKGWNTKRDGSGFSVEDEGAIYDLNSSSMQNLIEHYGSEKFNTNDSTITLYAQWEYTAGEIRVNSHGGKYKGVENWSTSIEYGDTIKINLSGMDCSGVQGYNVNYIYDGSSISSDQSEMIIESASVSNSSNAIIEYSGKNNCDVEYTFYGDNNDIVDIDTRYRSKPIILKNLNNIGNKRFYGWYYEQSLENLAGFGNEVFHIKNDITLYAKFEIDYGVRIQDAYFSTSLPHEYDNVAKTIRNGEEVSDNKYDIPTGATNIRNATGAIDINLESLKTSSNRIFKLYTNIGESGEETWLQTDDISNPTISTAAKTFGAGDYDYTIESSGIYRFVLNGGQGQNYSGSAIGGRGGQVAGNIYLRKGDVARLHIGAQGRAGSGTYLQGGDYSSLNIKKKGSSTFDLIMIAGGGGAAAEGKSGYAGGSTASNVSTMEGQRHSGKSYNAGGNGYKGGTAGNIDVVLHHHNGGCYKNKYDLMKVGTGVWTESGGGMVCQGGGATVFAPSVDGRLGTTSDVCVWYDVTNGSILSMYRDEREDHWGDKVLNCNKVYDRYIVNPSYGGSNYVMNNSSGNYIFSNTSSSAGVASGNGSVTISPVDIGYLDELEQLDIKAPDVDNPIIKGEPYAICEGNDIKVAWDEDIFSENGTQYKFKIEQFDLTNSGIIKVDTINNNSTKVTSAIAGYYISFEEEDIRSAINSKYGEEYKEYCGKGAGYTWKGHTAEYDKIFFTDETEYSVDSSKKYKNIYIAGVDVAGNISDTVTLNLENLNYAVKDISLDLIDYGEQDKVYYNTDKNKIFVNGNYGVSSVGLKIESSIFGYATDTYQINRVYTNFKVNDDDINKINAGITNKSIINTISNVSNDEIVLTGERLSETRDNAVEIDDSREASAIRKSNATELELKYYVSPVGVSGDKLTINAQSAVSKMDKDIALSSVSNDIVLWYDTTGPIISGLNKMKRFIDRTDEQIVLEITAADSESGMQDRRNDRFWVKVSNIQNSKEQYYYPDVNGVISVFVNQSSALFTGEFIVTAHAEDNVGNVTEKSFSATEMDIKMQVVRDHKVIDGSDLYNRGEYGTATIFINGGFERLDLEFRDTTGNVCGMSECDTSILLDSNNTFDTEVIKFRVPVDLEDSGITQEYLVTAKAYNGGKCIETTKSIFVRSKDDASAMKFKLETTINYD